MSFDGSMEQSVLTLSVTSSGEQAVNDFGLTFSATSNSGTSLVNEAFTIRVVDCTTQTGANLFSLIMHSPSRIALALNPIALNGRALMLQMIFSSK